MAKDDVAEVVEKSEEKAAARNRDSNSEATVENSAMKDEDGSSRKWWVFPSKEESHDPEEPILQKWKKIFVASCLLTILQAYLQFETTRIETHRHKMKVKQKMKEKGQEIELWLFGIPENEDIKSQIMERVEQELEEDRDADLDYILSTLPKKIQIRIKSGNPITRLKQVPIFQNMDESVLKAIRRYLEPKKYTKNVIITQEGKPLEMMLYIVDGFVNIEERDGSNNLQRGAREVYGEELLSWPLSNSFPDVLPSATLSAMAGSDVVALALTARDLKSVVFEFGRQYFFGMITCKMFSAKEVEKATETYQLSTFIRRQQTITSRGVSTRVYKGVLADKTEVEVKRYIVNCSYDDYPYLVKLVAVASRTDHKNLVRLLGCCLEGQTIALVSEYIPNACTLFQRIHGKEGKPSSPLSLALRMKIASESAGALAYLRSLITTPILPSFVSTTSILLDDNCTAKLCSFGLGFVPNDSRYSLSSIRQGCFDPKSKTLIEKLDVYGIGVVLAELLTGPNGISSSGDRDLTKLAKLFLLRVEEDRLKEILDDIIVKEGDFETPKKVAHLATRCLRYKQEEMPSMKEVVAELEGILRNLRAEQGGEASFS